MSEETTESTKPASTDARPYDEELWKRGQRIYFQLLDVTSKRAPKDPALLSEARDFCMQAEKVLRALEDYDDFVQRVAVSDEFYSESARVKKTEIYLKQLFQRKNRVEQLVREIG
jgi:hypothetical protein